MFSKMKNITIQYVYIYNKTPSSLSSVHRPCRVHIVCNQRHKKNPAIWQGFYCKHEIKYDWLFYQFRG